MIIMILDLYRTPGKRSSSMASVFIHQALLLELNTHYIYFSDIQFTDIKAKRPKFRLYGCLMWLKIYHWHETITQHVTYYCTCKYFGFIVALLNLLNYVVVFVGSYQTRFHEMNGTLSSSINTSALVIFSSEFGPGLDWIND